MEKEALETLAAQARERAQQAHEAAQRARGRVQELAGRRPSGKPAEGAAAAAAAAADRRILAEERLARLEFSLGKARQRSVDAHERAALVDDAVGKTAEASDHREAANQQRQLIADEADQAAARQGSKPTPRGT